MTLSGKKVDLHYSVKGGWPFPGDMLRRDCAVAATPEDQAKIDMLSGECAPDRAALRRDNVVNLVIKDAGRRDLPLADRWASFRWSVLDGEEDEGRKKALRMQALRRQAFAKLTEEEIEAIRWTVEHAF